MHQKDFTTWINVFYNIYKASFLDYFQAQVESLMVKLSLSFYIYMWVQLMMP